MNVSLTPVLENFVKEKVESGLYNNASEVVREALRKVLLEEERSANLRSDVATGFSQLDEGKTTQISSKEEFLAIARAEKK